MTFQEWKAQTDWVPGGVISEDGLERAWVAAIEATLEVYEQGFKSNWNVGDTLLAIERLKDTNDKIAS